MQTIPTLGPKACKCYLHWAMWITIPNLPPKNLSHGPTTLHGRQVVVVHGAHLNVQIMVSGSWYELPPKLEAATLS